MAAQDQPEKKDQPVHGKAYGASVRSENDFTDPQSLQAEGKRSLHAQPGHRGAPASKAKANPKTDNTRSHGNRPKGSNQGGVDHD